MVRSILALSLLAFPACFAAALLEPADSILLNGQVLVFSGPERHDSVGPPRFEQAVAIRDGRIVFVGTSEEARKYAGPATSVTDLRGRMVMPGIVDGHFHGTRYTDCDLGYEGGTIPQVLAKLQACLDRPDQAAHKGTQRPALRAQLLRRGALAARDAADARGPRPARHDPPGPGAQCGRPQVLAEQPRHRQPRHRRAHARSARRPDRPRRRGPAERLLRRHGIGGREQWRGRTGAGGGAGRAGADHERRCQPHGDHDGVHPRLGRGPAAALGAGTAGRRAHAACKPRAVRRLRSRHAGSRRAREADRRAR